MFYWWILSVTPHAFWWKMHFTAENSRCPGWLILIYTIFPCLCLNLLLWYKRDIWVSFSRHSKFQALLDKTLPAYKWCPNIFAFSIPLKYSLISLHHSSRYSLPLMAKVGTFVIGHILRYILAVFFVHFPAWLVLSKSPVPGDGWLPAISSSGSSHGHLVPQEIFSMQLAFLPF